MNTVPDPERIATEITRLQAIRPSVPKYSAFGEDNHAAIDVQIALLIGTVSLQELFERSEPTLRFAGPTQYTLDQAQLVHDWLTGILCATEGSPADGWEVFAK